MTLVARKVQGGAYYLVSGTDTQGTQGKALVYTPGLRELDRVQAERKAAKAVEEGIEQALAPITEALKKAAELEEATGPKRVVVQEAAEGVAEIAVILSEEDELVLDILNGVAVEAVWVNDTVVRLV